MASLVDSGGKTVIGIWQAIKPTGTTDTNLVSNPSFELGTTGWTTVSAALVQTAGGKFGSKYGAVTASANGGGAYFTSPTIASGTLVVCSAWVLASSPLANLQGDGGGPTFTCFHPGDGLWHRLEVAFTMPSTTTARVWITDNRTSAWTVINVDGVQIETGVSAATTYIDGDQDGCSWTGTPHGSTSTRDGRDGRGGSIATIDQQTVALGSYQVLSSQGIGVPEMSLATTELALADGAIYQRSMAKTRDITLKMLLVGNGTLAGIHTARRALLDILNPESRTNRGPVTLRYIGSSTPRLLQAYYAGGLEQGEIKGVTEEPELKFTAPDPMWRSETEESAALTASQSLTTGRIAYRDSSGVWSGLADSTAATGESVSRVGRLPDGRLVVAGYVNNWGGVSTADSVSVWSGTAWTALGSFTTVGGIGVECMVVARNGDVYVAGNFTDGAGIANADRIAKWTYATNTWSALSTGANDMIMAIAEDPVTGYIWVIGDFTSIGGVTVTGGAYWNGSAFVAAAPPAATHFASSAARDLICGPDGRMYAAGLNGVYVWNGSAWVDSGTASGTNLTYTLASVNGKLYAGGGFTTIGGVAAARIAVWNGSSWAPLGSGVSSGAVWRVGALLDGTVYAAGINWGTVGGITPPDNLAAWNGSIWTPFPANPADTGTHANDQRRVHVLPDQSVAVTWHALSGTYGTTSTVPGRTTITNSGSATAYPIITISSDGQMYYIKNATTNQTIVFDNISGAVRGVVTIDLRPGRKTVKGENGANLLVYVLPSSDLATFGLVPGTNVIEVYVGGTTTAAMRWKPSYWSAD